MSETQRAEPLFGRISSESVRDATGRGWEEWLEILDGAGARDREHKEVVAHLRHEHPEVSAWWRQALTVGYEHARGKRVAGQTADAGFQVGVQRSVALTAGEAWQLLTSRPELWLGEGASVSFVEGERYVSPAASGEIRVVKPGDRLRMTWEHDGWRAPATLQFTVMESGAGKTAIQAHMEKLPDSDAREAMRARLREALERIAAAAH